MKTQHRITIILFILLFAIANFASTTFADNKVYLMTGKISSIDMAYDTVVIEVPLGSQMFTVGGPLDRSATLTKNGRPASLDDFKVGDSVKVRWRSTPKGHVIEVLSGE